MMSKVLNVMFLFVALGAAAESSISDVVVNQRWPWNEKVDVDFVLSGETSDVDVTVLPSEAVSWKAGTASPTLMKATGVSSPSLMQEVRSKKKEVRSKKYDLLWGMGRQSFRWLLARRRQLLTRIWISWSRSPER